MILTSVSSIFLIVPCIQAAATPLDHTSVIVIQALKRMAVSVLVGLFPFYLA